MVIMEIEKRSYKIGSIFKKVYKRKPGQETWWYTDENIRCYWQDKCGKEHRIDGPAMKDEKGRMAWFYHGKMLHIHPDKVSVGDTIFYGYRYVIVIRKVAGLIYQVIAGDDKFLIMFEQKKYMEVMAKKGKSFP